MPWYSPDLNKATYADIAAEMTYAQLAIIEKDLRMKAYIKDHFKLLYKRIEEAVDDEEFDPTEPLFESLKPLMETILEREIAGDEDPYQNFAEAEHKLIKEATIDKGYNPSL